MSAQNILESITPTSVLRRRNREQILRFIANNGSTTRSKLAEVTGLTLAAISRITRELLDAGLLIEGEHTYSSGRVGRREARLIINPEGAYVLAISLTANRRSVVLANAVGQVVSAADCDDLDPAKPHELLQGIAGRAKTLAYDAEINLGRLLGGGVSAAVSEGSTQELITSDPLGWQAIPVRSILSEHLDLPVKVEHRASAILRAELNQRDQSKDCYLINVALRTGASAFLDGRLNAPGSKGFGSLSHFRVHGNDRLCNCGRLGCLDACASGKAILTALERVDCQPAETARRLVEAVSEAESGDARVCEAFHHAGENLAYGIEAVMSLFGVETVILAGEVGRQTNFIEGVESALREMGRSDTRIERSNITSTEAATSVALQEYVLTDALNLVQLKAA